MPLRHKQPLLSSPENHRIQKSQKHIPCSVSIVTLYQLDLSGYLSVQGSRPVFFHGLSSGAGERFRVSRAHDDWRIATFQCIREVLQLGRALSRWARYDSIAVDEVGYVPLAEVGAEFLFQVIAERAEKAAVIVTTNLPFSE